EDAQAVLEAADGQAHAQVGELGVQDVPAVAGAAEPAAHHLVDRELPLGDVLAHFVRQVASRLHPAARGEAIGGVVVVVGAGEHVLGVLLGGGVQVGVGGQGGAAGGPARRVDLGEHGRAHRA